jgi:glycosyltransferase involved in cell wall biosynthesis
MPGVVVRTTVVLDGCTDETAAVVAAYGVDTVVVDATCVGVARAAGVERVVELAGGHLAERVLVASTDADCVVPETWLVELLAHAAAGHDLVVGAVHPDPDDLPVGVVERWWARHRRPEEHVHGANLAFTLAAASRRTSPSWSQPSEAAGARERQSTIADGAPVLKSVDR